MPRGWGSEELPVPDATRPARSYNTKEGTISNVTDVPERLDLLVDCPGCNGEGSVTDVHSIIDPAYLDVHIAEHRGVWVKETSNFLDQSCDCPRVEVVQPPRPCIACVGKGERVMAYWTPKIGETVIVKDEILTGLFGEGNEPEPEARVFKITYPETMHELRHPIGVHVTWDRLTKVGTIPKGGEIEGWVLDITEFKRV